MAQTCKPSEETSSDCDGCFTSSSLAADFHVAPWSCESTTPPVVAANHPSVAKTMSLTWNAKSCGAFAFGAGFLTNTVVYLPLTTFVTLVGAEASGASAANNPAFTHLPVVSSYFIQPPLLSDAHHPVGAA